MASLVPAATDLLIGMGAGDHLVAVSTWDAPRPQIANLPRVGDYRTFDWEKLILSHPDLMIVQFAPAKMPAGLLDQAQSLHITPVNMRMNHLDEVFTALHELGDAVHEQQKADRAGKSLRQRLDAVRARVAGEQLVTTLITRAEPAGSLACVGGGNYLDEILTIAGGRNVLAGGENSYPTIDAERVLDLQPQVVLVLLPGESPQVVKQTEEFWRTMPQVPAVRDGRVYILTDSYLLLPGLSAADVAEQFAARLHPQSPTGAVLR